MGRQHQGTDRPEVRQVPEDSGEQRTMEETGCEVICGAPTTLAVKGQVKMKVKVKAGSFTSKFGQHEALRPAVRRFRHGVSGCQSRSSFSQSEHYIIIFHTKNPKSGRHIKPTG